MARLNSRRFATSLGFWRSAESFNQLALGLLQVDRRLPVEERAKVWLEV